MGIPSLICSVRYFHVRHTVGIASDPVTCSGDSASRIPRGLGDAGRGDVGVSEQVPCHTATAGVVTNRPPAHRYLSYTLNPDLIRKQDATSTINNIASNVVGQTLVWDFVRSNWKKLFEE